MTPLLSPISFNAFFPSPTLIGKFRTLAESRAENDSIKIGLPRYVDRIKRSRSTILTPCTAASPGIGSSFSGTFLGPAVLAPELTIKSAVTIWSTHASSDPRTLLTKVAMVKIAARLITMVATVIPERTGLRRRLSDASRASIQDTPGRRKEDRHNPLIV